MKTLTLLFTLALALTAGAQITTSPGGGGGTVVATATNAIGNNAGKGTNTSLYGTTTFASTSGGTNVVLEAASGGKTIFTNASTHATFTLDENMKAIGNGGGLTNLNIVFAEVIISTNRPTGTQTNWFGPWTPGTTTAGIQEALNLYAPANPSPANSTAQGITVRFMPGDFRLSRSVILSNDYYQQIKFIGAGIISSVLYAPSNVFVTTTTNTFYHHGQYYFSDMAFVGYSNVQASVVELSKASVQHFDRCYFTWNGYITNAGWGINLSAYTNPITVPMLLGGVSILLEDENETHFANCYFQGLAYGAYLGCAHPTLLDNHFVHIGKYISGNTNAWAITDARASGAAIVMHAGTYEMHVERNQFVGCRNIAAFEIAPVNNYFVHNYYESAGGIVMDDPLNLGLIEQIGEPAAVYIANESDWTVTTGTSLWNFASGFNHANIVSVGGTYWTVYGNGANQMAMDSFYNWTMNGNLTLSSGKTFIGNLVSTNIVNNVKSSFFTNYTAKLTDAILACNGTNQLITVLTNASIPTGFILHVSSVNINGSVILTNINGSQTIGGALSQTIPATNAATIWYDGANWQF